MADRGIFNNFKARAAKLLGFGRINRNLTKKERLDELRFKNPLKLHYKGYGHGNWDLIVNGYPKKYKHLQNYPKLLASLKNGRIKVLTRHGIIITRLSNYTRLELELMKMNK